MLSWGKLSSGNSEAPNSAAGMASIDSTGLFHYPKQHLLHFLLFGEVLSFFLDSNFDFVALTLAFIFQIFFSHTESNDLRAPPRRLGAGTQPHRSTFLEIV